MCVIVTHLEVAPNVHFTSPAADLQLLQVVNHVQHAHCPGILTGDDINLNFLQTQ